MEIPFEGQVTQEDLLRAQSLHLKPPTTWLVVGGVLLALIILACIVTFASEPAFFWSLLPGLAIPIVIFSATWVMLRLQAVSHWKNNKALRDRMSGTITPQAIHYARTHSEAKLSWEVYPKYKRSPDIVLLYQAPNLINIFKKTYFRTDADWESFIELVEKNVRGNVLKNQDKTQKLVRLVFVILLIAAFIWGLIKSLSQP